MGARGPRPTPVIDRLLANVKEDEHGCWIWTGYCKPAGYGQITPGKDEWHSRTAYTHVIAYHFLVGPVPEGKQLDHLCRVRRCCNPEHLEPVTSGVNTKRGQAPHVVAHRENRCIKGHLLDAANSYVNPTTGWRRCRTCRAAYMKAYRSKVSA